MTADAKATAEVRARIDQWAASLRAKDVEGIMASHSADVLAFDCHSQLQFKGADAYRRHLEACMPGMQGSMDFELHGLAIGAKDDLPSAMTSRAAARRQRTARSIAAGCAGPRVCVGRPGRGESCRRTAQLRSTR
jgi:ketosteroid isomerase-like protein